MKKLIELLIPDGKERYKSLYKKKEQEVLKNLLDELNQDEVQKLLNIGALNNVFVITIDFYWIDIFIIKDSKIFLWKNGTSEEKTIDDIFSEYTHQFALNLDQLYIIQNMYS